MLFYFMSLFDLFYLNHIISPNLNIKIFRFFFFLIFNKKTSKFPGKKIDFIPCYARDFVIFKSESYCLYYQDKKQETHNTKKMEIKL